MSLKKKKQVLLIFKTRRHTTPSMQGNVRKYQAWAGGSEEKA